MDTKHPLTHLKESLEKSPIVKKGDYDYFIHPITDGIPEIRKELLDEVTDAIASVANGDYNKIVAVEAMGIPLSTALSMRVGVPLVIIRKKSYGLDGEIIVSQKTGYSKGMLTINCIDGGDKLLLLDDVLSTGGTIRSVIKGLKATGAEIKDIIVVIDKSKGNVKEKIEKDLNVKIKTLLKVDIVDGKVRILRN